MMSKHILMSKPDFFKISYEINPWMKLDNKVDVELAKTQWQALYDLYTKTLNWKVELIEPQADLPDMVFTANGGLVIDNKVVVANFRHPDRQGETKFFKTWFEFYGFKEVSFSYYNFEGEGDALLWNDYLLMGFPWRSDYACHSFVGEFFNKKVISLQLSNAKFYHLDTCLTPLSKDTVAIYPLAFSQASLNQLRKIVPNLIEASSKDAYAYGLNACSDGKRVVLADQAFDLIDQYKALGFEVYPMAMSEFLKSGGGVKCLSLEFH